MGGDVSPSSFAFFCWQRGVSLKDEVVKKRGGAAAAAATGMNDGDDVLRPPPPVASDAPTRRF